MDGADFVFLFFVIVFVTASTLTGIGLGRDFMVDWICEDAGYEDGKISDGTRWCVYEEEGTKVWIPLDSLIQQAP